MGFPKHIKHQSVGYRERDLAIANWNCLYKLGQFLLYIYHTGMIRKAWKGSNHKGRGFTQREERSVSSTGFCSPWLGHILHRKSTVYYMINYKTNTSLVLKHYTLIFPILLSHPPIESLHFQQTTNYDMYSTQSTHPGLFAALEEKNKSIMLVHNSRTILLHLMRHTPTSCEQMLLANTSNLYFLVNQFWRSNKNLGIPMFLQKYICSLLWYAQCSG